MGSRREKVDRDDCKAAASAAAAESLQSCPTLRDRMAAY